MGVMRERGYEHGIPSFRTAHVDEQRQVTSSPVHAMRHVRSAGFDGYFYEQICDNVLTANLSLGKRRGTGDKLARDYAKGCAAMYPLPDLEQSTCQSMIPLWIVLIIYIFWVRASLPLRLPGPAPRARACPINSVACRRPLAPRPFALAPSPLAPSPLALCPFAPHQW